MFCNLPSAAIVLLLVFSIGSVRGADEPHDRRVRVEPENVRIGPFYSGRGIQVKATTAGSADVVIRVAGRDEPVTLKKKGRKYGFLWMNVGEVHYEAVPTLYIVRSTRALDEIADNEALSRLKIGFDALKDQVPAESEDGAREFFGELIKLKQRDHLFVSEAAGVELHAGGARQQEVTSEFLLPAKAPVGDYTVDVFSFQGGKGDLIGTAKVDLKRGSVVSFITSLATHHGLLYGCLAVTVAVLAGLATGFIFGKGKGGAH
jgi:uncharacterized protein (TIGR02186 family)